MRVLLIPVLRPADQHVTDTRDVRDRSRRVIHVVEDTVEERDIVLCQEALFLGLGRILRRVTQEGDEVTQEHVEGLDVKHLLRDQAFHIAPYVTFHCVHARRALSVQEEGVVALERARLVNRLTTNVTPYHLDEPLHTAIFVEQRRAHRGEHRQLARESRPSGEPMVASHVLEQVHRRLLAGEALLVEAQGLLALRFTHHVVHIEAPGERRIRLMPGISRTTGHLQKVYL